MYAVFDSSLHVHPEYHNLQIKMYYGETKGTYPTSVQMLV